MFTECDITNFDKLHRTVQEGHTSEQRYKAIISEIARLLGPEWMRELFSLGFKVDKDASDGHDQFYFTNHPVNVVVLWGHMSGFHISDVYAFNVDTKQRRQLDRPGLWHIDKVGSKTVSKENLMRWIKEQLGHPGSGEELSHAESKEAK